MLTRNNSSNRRLGIERREFSYSFCIPERRGGQNRRQENERRKGGNINTRFNRRKTKEKNILLKAA